MVIRNKYLYSKRIPYYLFFVITILSSVSCNYHEKKHSNNKEMLFHITQNVNIDSLIKINQYKILFLDLYSGMNREIFDLVINKLVTEGKLRDFGLKNGYRKIYYNIYFENGNKIMNAEVNGIFVNDILQSVVLLGRRDSVTNNYNQYEGTQYITQLSNNFNEITRLYKSKYKDYLFKQKYNNFEGNFVRDSGIYCFDKNRIIIIEYPYINELLKITYKLGQKKDVVKRQKKQLEEIRTKSFEKNKEKTRNYKESIDNL